MKWNLFNSRSQGNTDVGTSHDYLKLRMDVMSIPAEFFNYEE